jgi:hypothetical protein
MSYTKRSATVGHLVARMLQPPIITMKIRSGSSKNGADYHWRMASAFEPTTAEALVNISHFADSFNKVNWITGKWMETCANIMPLD